MTSVAFCTGFGITFGEVGDICELEVSASKRQVLPETVSTEGTRHRALLLRPLIDGFEGEGVAIGRPLG